MHETQMASPEQYKSDLANAIRDIRLEFDNLANVNKKDLESLYVISVSINKDQRIWN